MTFENNIKWYMHKNLTKKQHINIFLPSIANLKCTPSDRQMYPQGYMYPRLGTPVLLRRVILRRARFGTATPGLNKSKGYAWQLLAHPQSRRLKISVLFSLLCVVQPRLYNLPTALQSL